MPRDTLTRDRIVRTAVELLDDEGLDALNMRSLGKRLGAAPTAVYWHVKNKDELILAAGDLVWHEVALPDSGGQPWRAAAVALATELHGMLGRHPWLVTAFGRYMTYGPGKARYDDRCLAVYEAAGFTAGQADQAGAAVFTFVLGSVLAASAATTLVRRLTHEGVDAQAALAAHVERARQIGRDYPHLRRRLDDVPSDDYAASPGHTFEVGLDALLDGLTARLGRH